MSFVPKCSATVILSLVLILIIQLSVITVCDETEESLCENVDIRNSVVNLNKIKSCEVITGYLQIVLIDKFRYQDFANYTFPKLREITGYLMMHRVFGIKSLEKLFPNLEVIRGRKLFVHHSLILVEMRDLEKVGLINLVAIQRGFVHIQDCPNLCYTETIDWDRLTISMNVNNPTPNYIQDEKMGCPNATVCAGCPDKRCWYKGKCQRQLITTSPSRLCHVECMTGCKNILNTGCFICKNLSLGKKCVSKCDNNTVLHELSQKCYTREECSRINHVVFQNQCLEKCPAKYTVLQDSRKSKVRLCTRCESGCPKVCQGKEIKYLFEAEKFRGCTRINGSLHIKMNVDLPNLLTELQTFLGDIETIRDNLKIYRSVSLESLSFLRSLSSIEGKSLENGKYAVMVYENPSLQELWDWDLKRQMHIGNGIFFFHLNHNLCMREIESFKQITQHNNTMDDYIRNDTNGQAFTCDKTKNMHSDWYVVSSSTVTIKWDDYVYKNWTNFDYIIYYIEAPKTDITLHYGRDTCTKYSWRSLLLSSENIVKAYQLNEYNITDLKAYTQYAYYVRSYYTQELNEKITHGQSEIKYFKTLQAAPNMPYLHTLEKTDHSITIKLTINPNQYNLVESFYLGYYEIPDDGSYINNGRNYCLDPLLEGPDDKHNVPKYSCCDEHRVWEDKYEDAIERYSDGSFGQNCGVDTNDPDCEENSRRRKRETDYTHLDRIDQLDLDFGESVYQYLEIQNHRTPIDEAANLDASFHLKWDTVEHKIEGLKSFKLYTIMLSACNDECSAYFTYSERTLPVPEDDNIDFTMTNTSNSLIVTFIPAPNPNGATVAFEIQYVRIEYPIPLEKLICIPMLNGVENNTFEVPDLTTGMYGVRVRSISLGGTGRFSELQYLEVNNVNDDHLIAEIIIILVIFFILLSIGLFFGMKLFPIDFKWPHIDLFSFRKRNTTDDQNQLLQSIVHSGFDEVAWTADGDEIELETVTLADISSPRTVDSSPESLSFQEFSVNEGASTSFGKEPKSVASTDLKKHFIAIPKEPK